MNEDELMKEVLAIKRDREQKARERLYRKYTEIKFTVINGQIINKQNKIIGGLLTWKPT